MRSYVVRLGATRRVLSVPPHKYLHKYAGASLFYEEGRWRRYSSSQCGRQPFGLSSEFARQTRKVSERHPSSCLASNKNRSAYLHTYFWDGTLMADDPSQPEDDATLVVQRDRARQADEVGIGSVIKER